MITVVVIIAALTQLIVNVGSELFADSQHSWLGDDLIKVLGDLLTVLIALEVLQNVTSYLRLQVVQIELVLVTALTAVVRKVVLLPQDLMINLSYWLDWGLPRLLWPGLIGWSRERQLIRFFLLVPEQSQPNCPRVRISSFHTMQTVGGQMQLISHAEINPRIGIFQLHTCTPLQ